MQNIFCSNRIGLLLQLTAIGASAIILSDFAYAESVGNTNDDWRLQINADFSAPGTHSAREDHRLYRIDFACDSKNNLLPTRKVFDIIALKSVTTTHAVVVSTDSVPADATGKIKIPDKPLRLLTPYSMNGNNVVDNRKICPKDPIVISGTKPVYLYPVVTYSTVNTPGAIVKIGYSIAKLIPALWSIFQPEVIPADVARKVSSVGQTQGPMEEILSTFNQDSSYSKGFNLDVGRYVVTTQYSKITISVSALKTVVGASPSSIQETFRLQIKNAPEQVNAGSVNANCNTIANTLKDVGFSESEDIPYALVVLSSRLGIKAKIVECLEAAQATDAALNLGPILWNSIARSLVVTRDYVDNIQPSTFGEAKARIYNLIVALSRIAKGDPARAAEGLAQLQKSTTQKIRLADSINDYLGGSNDLSAQELSARLVDRNYKRFGCMTSIGDKNGAGVSNGVGSFLIIKAPVDAVSAELKDALVAHVIFKGGLISQIAVFEEQNWTKANLDSNEGNCNGFRLLGTPVAAVQ